MKKTFIGVLVVLLTAGGIAYFLKSESAQVHAPGLVPADTVVLLQTPDVMQTRERWKKTALYQIAHEPEIQAFLARPKAKLPKNSNVANRVDRVLRVNPKEAFLAVTSISDRIPKFVGGFSFKGEKSEVEKLTNELKQKAQAAMPAIKTDLIKYQTTEIETLSADEITIASSFKDNWYFISNNLDLLKATLDRADGKTDGKSLRESADYKDSAAKLPANADALFFAQLQSAVDRIVLLMTASGQEIDAKQMEELKKVRAISGGLKLDGETIRDAIFLLKPGSHPRPPMAQNARTLTTENTLLYYAGLCTFGDLPQRLPDPTLDATGVLRLLSALGRALDEQGLSMKELGEAFGPEVGSALDWPAAAAQPSLLLSLDVRDAAKAQKFVEFFTGGQMGMPAWGRQQVDDTQFYAFQTGGLVPVTPTLAMTAKTLVFGLSLDSVKQALERSKKGDFGLSQKAAFRQAEDSVAKPTSSFAYVDTKALFERVYGLGRPLLAMWAAFNPKAGEFVDATKLPSTEAISKHLVPIVFSQSETADGVLTESAGPVTGQMLVGAGIGTGIAMLPKLKEQLSTHGGTRSPHRQQMPAPQVTPLTPSVPSPSPEETPSSTPEPMTP